MEPRRPSRTAVTAAGAAILLLIPPAVRPYPLDGAGSTGIRRLAGYQLVHEGKIKGIVRLPAGALLRGDQSLLRLQGITPAFDITPATAHDPYLQTGLERIFGGRDRSYAVALLDISNPQNNVVWFNPQNDITAELTKRIDATTASTSNAARRPSCRC